MSTIGVVFGAIGGVVGLIVDAPQAISQLNGWGLQWLTNPDLLWSLIFVVPSGIALFWIWRKPDESSQPEDPDEVEYQKRLAEVLKDGTRRDFRLVMWLEDIRTLQREIHRAAARGKVDIPYFLNVLQVVYQARALELLGEEAAARYLTTLKFSKDVSKNLGIVLQTVIPLLEDEIFKALQEEHSKKAAAHAANAVGPVEMQAPNNQLLDDAKRVENVVNRIRRMLTKVPVPRTPGALDEISKAMNVSTAMYGQTKSDWKAETKAELRALVNDNLCEKYDRCFKQQEPALAARAFLDGLASHLKASDLR